MAQQIIQPRFQFIYNSLAAEGYKVFTYAAGTSNKKTTWTDQTKAIANTNPVILDVQGMADIWLVGSYKIVIATPTSADPPVGADIIYTVDKVIGFDLIDWTGLTASIADLNSTTTAILSKAGGYTVALLDRNKTILVDTTAGDVTINLLAATTALNTFNITIKKIDESTNKVIIDPNGAETIDLQTTFHLYDYNDFIEVHSDASNWKITSSLIRGTVRSITEVKTLDLDDNNKLINCDASGGAFLVNLPANTDVGRGYRVTIKKTDSSTNHITITPAGGELIDGETTLVEKSQNGASSLVATGTGWSIYSEFGIDVKSPLPPNFMNGMLIANGTDTVNDIDFQVGSCRNSTDSDNLTIGAILTKQMDANWVAGNNVGGLAVGVGYVNDVWYHCFVIAKPDGTTDAGFDTSVTAVNLLADATGYTLFRRVGSIRSTKTPAVIGIIQFFAREIGGSLREFRWTQTTADDISAVVGFVTANLTLSYVPLGIETRSILNVLLTGNGTPIYLNIFEKAQNNHPAVGLLSSTSAPAGGEFFVLTDTSQLISYTTSGGGGTVNLHIQTAGWQEFIYFPS